VDGTTRTIAMASASCSRLVNMRFGSTVDHTRDEAMLNGERSLVSSERGSGGCHSADDCSAPRDLQVSVE